MRDLLLVDGDISVANGDLETVDGIDSIKQAIDLALNLFKSEWFLDGDLGVPYFENILIKSPNLNAIRDIFKKKLISVSGVTAVIELSLNFDGASRTLAVSWKVSTDVGELSGSFSA